MPEIEPGLDTYEHHGRSFRLPNGIIVEKVDTPSFGENGTLELALSAIKMQQLHQPGTSDISTSTIGQA